MTPAQRAESLASELRRVGHPERAAGEQAYLKSELVHLGVGTPAMRAIALRTAKTLTRAQLLALVPALWRRGIWELRAVAAEMLAARHVDLVTADLALVERLLRDSHTWALVDSLAPRVVGALHAREPAAVARVLDRWARDADFWIRRAAMLALLPALRAGAGDWERFARYADAMLEQREFFIRKAIGWVLRETSKRRPELVRAWIEPRAARASGVTLREARKYLDKPRP